MRKIKDQWSHLDPNMAWRKRHPENAKRMRLARTEVKKEFVRSLRSKPCASCRKKFPWYVMEFDHVRGKKVASPNLLCHGNASWTKLKRELAKGQFVCANCHRRRTWRRKQQM